MPEYPILEIKAKDMHLFLQDGFFNAGASTATLHFHGYTEIHMVIRGQLQMLADGQLYTLSGGDMLAIPEKLYHSCVSRAADTCTVAFQIARPLSQLKTAKVSLCLAQELSQQICSAKQTGRFDTVVLYLSLFCRSFFEEKPVTAERSSDVSLIISEFFSNRYSRQVSLQTLAGELKLSEKQTARLVKKVTGKTFLQELTARRLHAADYLIQTTQLTMGQIAERVGFRSYSGFWKAYKKKAAPICGAAGEAVNGHIC